MRYPTEEAPIEQQGLGYKSSFGTGKGKDTITSGLEGAWTSNPTKWDNGYFENLFKHEWTCIKGPGGKNQWEPKDSDEKTVPDAHIAGKYHKPMMFTTDIALKEDPSYRPISKHFYENPDEFASAFAKAWYKLTHRDMGPVVRLVGKDVAEPQIWQDPLPTSVNMYHIEREDIDALRSKVLGATGTLKSRIFGTSGPGIAELVKVAWASASTFRHTDFRGGANGARIRLDPQRKWEANDPKELDGVLKHLERIQNEFNTANNGTDMKRISMADLIVLAGNVAVEQAAKEAGIDIQIPFLPGRTDALPEQTDGESFAPLEPIADGFRNYYREGVNRLPPEECLLDRAHLLNLTAPEMTVLIGGLRAMGANSNNTNLGVLTAKQGVLSNDFFVNLLDNNISWEKVDDNCYKAVGSKTPFMASRADLVFGHNSELRAVAEYYACDDAKETLVKDFVNAWVKVMNADRYDIPPKSRAEAII